MCWTCADLPPGFGLQQVLAAGVCCCSCDWRQPPVSSADAQSSFAAQCPPFVIRQQCASCSFHRKWACWETWLDCQESGQGQTQVGQGPFSQWRSAMASFHSCHPIISQSRLNYDMQCNMYASDPRRGLFLMIT